MLGQGRVAVGHPVDVGSGAVYTLSDDFVVPGSLEVRWRRHYSTAVNRDTWLGIKWTVPYFMTLRILPDGYLLDGAHGERVDFSASAAAINAGKVVANLTASMELHREGDHYSVLHWHNTGEVTRFCFRASNEECLLLAWIENLAGHRVQIEYDTSGRPVHIVQELESRKFEIRYHASGLISAIYFLSESGPKPQVEYEYDAQRRLLASNDAMGYRKSYEYDDNDRLVGETNPLGSRFIFEYDRLGRCIRTAGDDGFRERKLQYFKAPPMTRVTAGNGAVTQYYLNPAGQVVQIIYPMGGVVTDSFDEHGRLIRVSNSDGSTESYSYDDNGNRVASIDPSGAKATLEHNDLHVPVRIIDRNGNAWQLTNKYEGSLAGVENLPRRVWEYSWDSRRLVAQARSLGGWVIQIRRDQTLRWQERHDDISLISRIEFDEFGHPIMFSDSEGVVSRTIYDALHRPVKVVQGDSEVTRYEWDPIGRMTERVGPGSRYEAWEYDKYGQLVAHTNSLGYRAIYEYDKEGRLISLTNRAGEQLTYRRDLEGRIVEEKLFDGRIQRYEYDLSGRRVLIHLSDGRTIKQRFDACGRLLSRESSDGLVDNFAYDNEGRVIKAWNSHSTVEFTRDSFGRIVTEIQNGRRIRYRYNLDSNLISRSLPFSSFGSKLTRICDRRGRLLALQDERGTFTEFRWDKLDRVLERRSAAGLSERFEYDSGRRLHRHRVEGAYTDFVRFQFYDSSGNLAILEDSRRGTTAYSYDALDRLTEVRKGGHITERYDYDANSAILRTHRGPRYLGRGSRSLRDGSWYVSYGADGAVAQIASGASVWSLKHDVNGRLIDVATPDGTVARYEYDPFGRRTAKTIGQTRIEFLWEIWSLAAEIRDGTVEGIFAFSDLRPVAQWKNGKRLVPVLDHRGAVTEVFDESGRESWSCELDAYGNLLSAKGEAPSPFRLRGQYQDAETGFYYNFYRHYHPALGDYTAPDPIGVAGGLNLYAYPRNPLRWDDPYGLTCGDDTKHEDDKPADEDKPKGTPPPEPAKDTPPGTPATNPPGGPGSGPHSSGPDDPPLTGMPPNALYTRTSGDGAVAVQNTVYDQNGAAVAHVDFKPHGPDAPSGHAHEFPPGGPVAGGHGPGADHVPPADVPPDWSKTPTGVPPAYPIGATTK